MKTVAFAASETSCHEVDGVLMVAFAAIERAGVDAEYLILQRTLEPTAEDQRLGMDGPYLELSDQSRGMYHGARLVELRESSLRIVLHEAASRRFGAEEIEVRLQPGVDQERLSRALQTVLRGTEFYCFAV